MRRLLDLPFQRIKKPGFPSTKMGWDFCYHRAQGKTRNQAALDAGYAKNSAEKHSHKMAKNYEACIDWMMDQVTAVAKADYSIDIRHTLEEYAAIAFSDIGSYVHTELNDDGDVIDLRWKYPHELTAPQSKAVAKINFVPGANSVESYELYNKTAGLEKIGKKLGMFSEKLLIQNNTTLEVRHDLSGIPTDLLAGVEAIMLGGAHSADQAVLKKAGLMLSRASGNTVEGEIVG